jgi:hypothetical protein
MPDPMLNNYKLQYILLTADLVIGAFVSYPLSAFAEPLAECAVHSESDLTRSEAAPCDGQLRFFNNGEPWEFRDLPSARPPSSRGDARNTTPSRPTRISNSQHSEPAPEKHFASIKQPDQLQDLQEQQLRRFRWLEAQWNNAKRGGGSVAKQPRLNGRHSYVY